MIVVERQTGWDVCGANECLRAQSEMLTEYTPTQTNWIPLFNKNISQCADESIFKDHIDLHINDLDNFFDSKRTTCHMHYKHSSGHQKNPQRRKFAAELVHRIETGDTAKLTERFKNEWFVTTNYVKKAWAQKDDNCTYGNYMLCLNPKPGAEWMINERVRGIIEFNVFCELLATRDVLNAKYEIKIPPTSTVERTAANEEQLIAAIRKRWKGTCITLEGKPTLLHQVYGYKTKNPKHKVGKPNRKVISADFVTEWVQNCPSPVLLALVNVTDWEIDGSWQDLFDEEDGHRVKPVMAIHFFGLGNLPTFKAFLNAWKQGKFDFEQIYEDIQENYSTPYVYEKSFWEKYDMVNEEADWEGTVKLIYGLYQSDTPLITNIYSNKVLKSIWKGKSMELQERIVTENGNILEDFEIPADTTLTPIPASEASRELMYESSTGVTEAALKSHIKTKSNRVFNSNTNDLIHSKIDGVETVLHAEPTTFASSVSQSFGASINQIPKTDNFLCQSMDNKDGFGLYYNSYGWGVNGGGKLINAIKLHEEFMKPYSQWVCFIYIYIYIYMICI